MAMTATGDLDSAATLAYNLEVHDSLRAATLYSTSVVAKRRPTNQTHRGSSVRFWFRPDLTPDITPLTEGTDVTAGIISDSYIDVTINEYGQSTGVTSKAIATDMLEVDQDIAVLNGKQAADAYELLARTAMTTRAGAYATHIKYGGTATSTLTVTATAILTSAMVRETVARLRTDNVDPIANGLYLALVTPYQALDLREETGDLAWNTSRSYQDMTGINQQMTGTFGGCMFHESSRVLNSVDAATDDTDVAFAHILGQDAMAMAWAQKVCPAEPEARVAPVVDKLRRFHNVGWFWHGGFKLFRPESSWELQTATTTSP